MEFDEARKPHDPDDIRGGGGVGGPPGTLAQEQWKTAEAKKKADKEARSADPDQGDRPGE